MDALGLDPRVVRAATKRGFATPTPVQAKAIPLALEGKDVIAQASTGSGKTAAYLLPLLHVLLSAGPAQLSPRGLVLVPTRELCQQVKDEATALCAKCGDIRAGQLPHAGVANAVLASAAAAAPDVLVATPGRVSLCIREGFFKPGAISESLLFLVLDEADLLLSFGYEDDLATLARRLPQRCQRMLVSATLKPALDKVVALLLHDPVRVSIAEAPLLPSGAAGASALDPSSSAAGAPSIEHTVIRCPAQDKLLWAMALLRLGKAHRKALLFVSSADAAVRLRLFLEKFGVRAASLHGELPANSRQHVLQEFNRGLFDYLIATDEAADDRRGRKGGKGSSKQRAPEPEEEEDEEAEEGGEDGEEEDGAEEEGGASRGGRRGGRGRDFGVVRGIDFKNVLTVVNLEVPQSVEAYVHRVGRTGRAGQRGTAISLVAPEEELRLQAIEEAVLGRLADAAQAAAEAGAAGGSEDAAGAGGPGDKKKKRKGGQQRRMAPFAALSRDAVEALRYRATDCLRGIGRNAVREARLRELRAELLNSERLAAHFEDNPEDLALLKHDAPLVRGVVAPHLKHLPAYLRGGKLRKVERAGGAEAAPEGGAKEDGEKKKKKENKRKADGEAGEAAEGAGGEARGGEAGTSGEKRPEGEAPAGGAGGAGGAEAAGGAEGGGDGEERKRAKKKRRAVADDPSAVKGVDPLKALHRQPTAGEVAAEVKAWGRGPNRNKPRRKKDKMTGPEWPTKAMAAKKRKVNVRKGGRKRAR